MSHSYSQNYIHLVFSTKNRVRSITKDIQPRLWDYMAAIYRNHEIVTEAVGGIDDHVHLLFRLPARLALSKSVYLVKAFSSKWMKQFVPDFDWQEGYGASICVWLRVPPLRGLGISYVPFPRLAAGASYCTRLRRSVQLGNSC